MDQVGRRPGPRRPRARLLHVLPHAHREDLQKLHGGAVRGGDQDALRRRRDADEGRPRAAPEAAAQALHAEVAARPRRPPRDVRAAPALAVQGAAVPRVLAVERAQPRFTP